jgi:hypothetical protein
MDPDPDPKLHGSSTHKYICLIPPSFSIGTKLGDAGGDLHTEPEAARGQGGASPGVQPRPLSSSPHRRPPDRGRGRLPGLLCSHGRHQARQRLCHQGGKGNRVVAFSQEAVSRENFSGLQINK